MKISWSKFLCRNYLPESLSSFIHSCLKLLLVLKWHLNIVTNNTHICWACESVIAYRNLQWLDNHSECVPHVPWPAVFATNSNHTVQSHKALISCRAVGQLLSPDLNTMFPFHTPKKPCEHLKAQQLRAGLSSRDVGLLLRSTTVLMSGTACRVALFLSQIKASTYSFESSVGFAQIFPPSHGSKSSNGPTVTVEAFIVREQLFVHLLKLTTIFNYNWL